MVVNSFTRSIHLLLFSLYVRLCCNPMDYSSPGSCALHYLQSLLKFMSIELVMPSNHLILCCPLLLLPSIFPSSRVFSDVSALRIRWPKDWSFSFSIRPSNEHPGLISLRMDGLDLLTAQGTCKSLLQPHGCKASILQCSAFFTFQLSHLYLTMVSSVSTMIDMGLIKS